MSQFSASEQSGIVSAIVAISDVEDWQLWVFIFRYKMSLLLQLDILPSVFVPLVFFMQGVLFVCAVMCTNFHMLFIHAHVEQPQFVLG